MRRMLTLCLAVVSWASCNWDPIEPQLSDAELRVLFVGNSLTYTNGLPAMVQTIAEAAGHSLAQADISSPNFSLEDHWNTGATETITSLKADVVVFQQGPSSLPQNQIYLRDWTVEMDKSVKAAGGRSALFMVWPEAARKETAFSAVRDSYSEAALAVGGIFIPAGEAWREVWAADPEAELYGLDGFHPSALGSVVAALTIFRMLFDEPVTGLPAIIEPTTPGLPIIDLGTVDSDMIYQAVEAAVEEWGRR